VIQYTTFLSTWYQSTSSESPLFFFFRSASSQNFFGAAVASAIPHRSVFLGSPSSSPCFERIHIPIETLGDNRARAVENSPLGVLTLPHSPPEDSAAATGLCLSTAGTAAQLLQLPPRSIAPSSSCSAPPRTSPSDGRPASTHRSKFLPACSRAHAPPHLERAYHAPNTCCSTSALATRQSATLALVARMHCATSALPVDC